MAIIFIHFYILNNSFHLASLQNRRDFFALRACLAFTSVCLNYAKNHACSAGYCLARKYINNSLHLAQKYTWIFVRGHYLFLAAHSKLSEKCSLLGTDNVQGQISDRAYFCPKWRLLCLSSFKPFSQHTQ